MDFKNNNAKQKISILILALVVLLWACGKEKKSEIIEADLAFEPISFASAYRVSDNQYADLLAYMDSVLTGSIADAGDAELMMHFRELKKHGLLRNPYIFLQVELDSTAVIYLSEKEYDKVKDFSSGELYDEGKKVIVKLEIVEIEKDIYYSDNIIEVKKVKGKSRSEFDRDN